MYHSPKASAVGLHFCRRNQLLRAGIIACVGHIQRPENTFLSQLIQGFAGDGFHDILKGDEIEATVHIFGSRLAVTRLVADMVEEDSPFLGFIGIGMVCQQEFPLRISRQSGHVGHEVTDCGISLKIRQILTYFGIQVQEPFVHQRHGRHACTHHLAE